MWYTRRFFFSELESLYAKRNLLCPPHASSTPCVPYVAEKAATNEGTLSIAAPKEDSPRMRSYQVLARSIAAHEAAGGTVFNESTVDVPLSPAQTPESLLALHNPTAPGASLFPFKNTQASMREFFEGGREFDAIALEQVRSGTLLEHSKTALDVTLSQAVEGVRKCFKLLRFWATAGHGFEKIESGWNVIALAPFLKPGPYAFNVYFWHSDPALRHAQRLKDDPVSNRTVATV
jgi:hypothetical protein